MERSKSQSGRRGFLQNLSSSRLQSYRGSSCCQPNGHFSKRHLAGPAHFFFLYRLLSLGVLSLSPPSILTSYDFSASHIIVSVSIWKTTGHRQYSNPLTPSLTDSDDLVLAGCSGCRVWIRKRSCRTARGEDRQKTEGGRGCQGFVCKRKMSLYS